MGLDNPRLELRQVVVADAAPLDLVLTPGELVAVTGENGSDLLRVISGQAAPRTGRVLLDGRPVEHDDHGGDVPPGVALIPQGNALATMLTALENVVLPLGVRPDIGADPVAVAREALTAVGLGDSADHLVEELSGGQQQRVAIARALALQPRVLLGDQATTDLDPGNRTRVLELLRDLTGTGTTVLLASDDPAITANCDRIISLRPPTEHHPASAVRKRGPM